MAGHRVVLFRSSVCISVYQKYFRKIIRKEEGLLKHLDVRRWIVQNENKILELTAELVRYKTVNQVVAGTERECQYYIAGVLRDSLKMEVDLFSPEEVAGFHEHPAYFPGKDY